MTPEQVEDSGWSPEDWSSLNTLAAATLAEHAQLRRIIPEGPEAPSAYLVEVPRATGGPDATDPAKDVPYGFSVDATEPVTRLRVQLVVGAEQVHDLPRIRELVQRAAMRLAYVEDNVLAHGSAAGTPRTRASETVSESLRRAKGVFGAKADASKKEKLFDALNEGVRRVRREGYTGALRAAFGFEIWSRIAEEDESATSCLGPGDAASACVPPDGAPASDNRDRWAAIFAPDPGAIDLVWTQRPRIIYVGISDGNLTLRIEEAFLLRVKAPNAVATIAWQPEKTKSSGSAG